MNILKQGILGTSFLLLIACNSGDEAKNMEDKNTTAETEQLVTEKPSATKTEKATLVGYQVGDALKSDFSLKNVDGEMVAMGDNAEAKGYVIVFTCNHCPYSIAYEDRLIELDKKYKALGYPVIAINPNDPTIVPEDSYEQMIARAKEKNFTFPYLFDDGQKVYPEYGATKTPHVYVVNKTEAGNKIAYIGAIDDNKNEDEVTKNYLANALDALVAGNEPEEAYTKAFGCSVKTAKKM
ncbi:MAG: thioredoxin family protein [Aureispira sp.]